jgi:hypothetical protein
VASRIRMLTCSMKSAANVNSVTSDECASEKVSRRFRLLRLPITRDQHATWYGKGVHRLRDPRLKQTALDRGFLNEGKANDIEPLKESHFRVQIVRLGCVRLRRTGLPGVRVQRRET